MSINQVAAGASKAVGGILQTVKSTLGMNPVGSNADTVGNIIIVNATDCDWSLLSASPQNGGDPSNFKYVWPHTIKSGTTFNVCLTFNPAINSQTVQYQIATKTGSACNFTLNTYSTPNYGVHMVADTPFIGLDTGGSCDLGQIQHTLGLDHDFVVCCISGTGTATSPSFWPPVLPTNWMHLSLPTIGDLKLRQLCVAYSHDAGMMDLHSPPLGGVAGNTQTQDLTIAEQLACGIRVYDLRPIWLDGPGKYYAYHGTYASEEHVLVGASGQCFDDICDQINQFGASNAELIILEIGEGAQKNTDGRFETMDAEQYTAFVAYLSQRLHCLFKTSDSGVDLTQLTINNFIGQGPAVIVAMSVTYTLPAQYLGQGFFQGNIGSLQQFYYTHLWSNSNDPQIVANQQLVAIQANRSASTDELFNLGWTCTLQIIDDVTLDHTLRSLAKAIQPSLYQNLLRNCTTASYPNMISLDYIGSAGAALANAVNTNFARLNVTAQR